MLHSMNWYWMSISEKADSVTEEQVRRAADCFAEAKARTERRMEKGNEKRQTGVLTIENLVNKIWKYLRKSTGTVDSCLILVGNNDET